MIAGFRTHGKWVLFSRSSLAQSGVRSETIPTGGHHANDYHNGEILADGEDKEDHQNLTPFDEGEVAPGAPEVLHNETGASEEEQHANAEPGGVRKQSSQSSVKI